MGVHAHSLMVTMSCGVSRTCARRGYVRISVKGFVTTGNVNSHTGKTSSGGKATLLERKINSSKHGAARAAVAPNRVAGGKEKVHRIGMCRLPVRQQMSLVRAVKMGAKIPEVSARIGRENDSVDSVRLTVRIRAVSFLFPEANVMAAELRSACCVRLVAPLWRRAWV